MEEFILDTCWVLFTTFDLTVLTWPILFGKNRQQLAGSGSKLQSVRGKWNGDGMGIWGRAAGFFHRGFSNQQPFLLLLLGSGAPGFLGRGIVAASVSAAAYLLQRQCACAEGRKFAFALLPKR